MTLGDLVLVNAFPDPAFTCRYTSLGFVYREIRHSLADMERMFGLLDRNTEVEDKPNAPDLVVRTGHIPFRAREFSLRCQPQNPAAT